MYKISLLPLLTTDNGFATFSFRRNETNEHITTIRALLETLIVAKPVKLKVTTFAKLHATTACYCRQCYPIRWQEARDAEQRMIEAGELPMQWQIIPQADWRTGGVKLDDPNWIRIHLSLCACGHSADAHDGDELDNLLACTAPRFANEPVEGKCRCDHFHYASEPIENEAA